MYGDIMLLKFLYDFSFLLLFIFNRYMEKLQWNSSPYLLKRHNKTGMYSEVEEHWYCDIPWKTINDGIKIFVSLLSDSFREITETLYFLPIKKRKKQKI